MSQIDMSDDSVVKQDKQAVRRFHDINNVSQTQSDTSKDDLARKQTTLLTTLTLLETQRSSLLQRLNALIPSALQQPLQDTYTPSIAAHSTPSNRFTFSPSSSEQLNDEAKAILKQHISALHSYNEIKDVAQGMMGLIAESRGVRIRDLYLDGEFGVAEAD